MFVKHAHVASGVLEVQASAEQMTLLKNAHRHQFEYTPRKGFLYVRSRAISSRTNDNFDTFPADELRKAWATFIGKPVFVNHHNDDHRRMRGVIIDAVLHEDIAPDGTEDTWIEVLMEVDAKRFPLLAQALIKHDIERTSMGCDVVESECSYCGNIARYPDDYCAHIQRMKGQRLRRKNPETGEIEDVLVHEICRGLSFFENSLLVEDPADPTAFTFGLDTRGILDEGDPELAPLAALAKTAKTNDDAYVALTPEQSERFQGTTVRKDDDGYYCHTHRARSDSYPSVDEIPDSAIQFIESTGSRKGSAMENSLDHCPTFGDKLNDGYFLDVDDRGVRSLDLAKAASKTAVYISQAKPGDSVRMFPSEPLREIERIEFDGTNRDGHIFYRVHFVGGGMMTMSTADDVEVVQKSAARRARSDSYASKVALTDVGLPTEVRVPDTIEPLRMQKCPVCDSDSSWNADGRCDVCGYLPPPKPFREPDTDVAKRTDHGGGWFDPDLAAAKPFSLGSKSNPVRQPHSTTKGQRVTEQGANQMNSKQQSVATAARRRQAARTVQPSEHLARENAELRDRLARAEAALRRRADADNPAQPVPEPAPGAPAESTAETQNEPEATSVDVTAPGGVIPDPQSAPADVTSVGGEVEDPILAGTNQTADVEVPVAGTTEVDPAAVIDVQPDASAETLGDPAYGGDWLNEGGSTVPDIGGDAARTAAASERARLGRAVAASRDRIWASIRLARLRIDAGLASGDDLEVAQAIERSAATMDVIRNETATLTALARRRPPAAQPRRQASAHRAPSLAGTSRPVIASVDTAADDTAIFE